MNPRTYFAIVFALLVYALVVIWGLVIVDRHLGDWARMGIIGSALVLLLPIAFPLVFLIDGFEYVEWGEEE